MATKDLGTTRRADRVATSTFREQLLEALRASDAAVDAAQGEAEQLRRRKLEIGAAFKELGNPAFESILQRRRREDLLIESETLEPQLQQAEARLDVELRRMWAARAPARDAAMRALIVSLNEALTVAASRSDELRLTMQAIHDATPRQLREAHFASHGQYGVPYWTEFRRLEVWREFIKREYGVAL